MRFRTVLLPILLVASAICRGEAPNAATSADDRAIMEVALKNFANWKKATFGEQSGVLAIAPASLAQPELKVERVKSLAPEIRVHVTDELAAAFVQRNTAGLPITSVVAGSPWVKVRPTDSNADPRDLPPGVKATGYITWPGISSDGASAIVQFHHTWSVHGAIVTYFLVKEGGTWHVVARDQTVFL